MPIKPEMAMQIQIYEWVKQCTDLPFIYVANDGKRSPYLGALMKRMGLMPGVSDCFLPRSNGASKGLWIELKVKPNKPTPAQLAFLERMILEGYSGFVAYSAEQAIGIIKQFYLIE